MSPLSLSHKTRDLNPNLSGFACERTSLLDCAFFQRFFRGVSMRVNKIIQHVNYKLSIYLLQ